MRKTLRWNWSMEDRVRELVAAAKADTGSWCFDLPSDPGRPMQAIVSRKILDAFEKAPPPFKIPRPFVREGALKAFDQLLVNYAGADLNHCVLIDKLIVQVKTKDGASFGLCVIATWEPGAFGVFSSCELRLREDFYIDRLLFQTELQHHAEELEE